MDKIINKVKEIPKVTASVALATGVSGVIAGATFFGSVEDPIAVDDPLQRTLEELQASLSFDLSTGEELTRNEVVDQVMTIEDNIEEHQAILEDLEQELSQVEGNPELVEEKATLERQIRTAEVRIEKYEQTNAVYQQELEETIDPAI